LYKFHNTAQKYHIARKLLKGDSAIFFGKCQYNFLSVAKTPEFQYVGKGREPASQHSQKMSGPGDNVRLRIYRISLGADVQVY
jgi:hypothetical protein